MIRYFVIFAVPCALLLYAAGLPAPIYLDDPNILLNARLYMGTRSLGFASFWLNDQINAVIEAAFPVKGPPLFRLGNVFIHAMAATALFWLARELSSKWTIAWAAATFFLIHPIQTQAVTYIAQRFESLAALLMLVSAAAYARFRNHSRRRWLVLCALSGIAAGLTKETAVMLPLWIVMIEGIFFDRSEIRKRAPYLLALAAVLFYPALMALRTSGGTLFWIPWTQYLISQGPVLAKYLQLIAWPRELFLFYDFPPVGPITWAVAAQWVLVLAVLAAGLYALKRNRLAGFGILTFFVLLLPVTLLPLPDLVFEHRVYPAMAGIALAVAAALHAVNPRVAVALFIIAAIPLAYRTIERNKEWRDPIRFLEAHRERFPTDPIILANLSAQYATHAMVDKALEASKTARQFEHRANRYYQNHVALVIATNLGFQYLQVNELDAAMREAERARKLAPKDAGAQWLMGSAQLAHADRRGASETYRALVAAQPQNRTAWMMLIRTLFEMNDTEGMAKAEMQLEQLDATPPRGRPRLQIPGNYRSAVVYGFVVLGLAVLVWVARTLWEIIAPPAALALALLRQS